LHLFGCGVGGDIKIFGSKPQHEIANTPSDHEGLEPRMLKAFNGANGRTRDHPSIDAHAAAPVDAGVVLEGPAMARLVARGEPGQRTKKFLDHA